jgi:hypothetical protein
MSVEDEQARFQREGRPGEIFGEYLMRTADRREIEFQTRRCADYAKDNARLRALIAEAEWVAGDCDWDGYHAAACCPWCEGLKFDQPTPRHKPDCRAFAATGRVR